MSVLFVLQYVMGVTVQSVSFVFFIICVGECEFRVSVLCVL